MSGYEQQVAKRLTAVYHEHSVPAVRELGQMRIAIVSDLHKGRRDGADDFAQCEPSYLAAVQHYWQNFPKAIEANGLDEQVIFPFLQMHIPKLEAMICFLRAERNEFKLSLANFEVLFKQLGHEKHVLRQQKIIDQLKEKGIYAVCLMRNHIQIEIESVYKPMDQQLHQDEKKELIQKCLKYKLGALL